MRLRGFGVVGVVLLLVGIADPAGAGNTDRSVASAAATCGVERWSVKTLQDARAGRVNFAPRSSTVDRMRRLDAPDIGRNTLRQPAEQVTYRLRVALRAAKLEDDSDVHLVIASPVTRRTMIAEFPDLGCTRRASANARRKMASARQAFIGACGTPSRSRFRRLTGSATITGVAFFDVIHGQRGVSPNGIELHPVLGFSSTNCGPA